MSTLNKLIAAGLVLGTFLAVGTVHAEDGTRSGTLRPKGIRQELKELLQERIQKIRENHPQAAVGSGDVMAINSTTLTVSRGGKIYIVLTDTTTQFRFRFWGQNAGLADIRIGHKVNVVGRWTDDAKTTIQAKLVRDLSLQKRFGVFVGEVKSLLTGGWVMSTVSEKRPDQTVTISAGTKFINRKEETISQTDIKVGHRVRVKGLWDMVNNTVTEVTHVKDYSLPARE